MRILLYKVLGLILITSVLGLGLAACGGGGGNAAPSGGSGSPVAVEIPSLDTISELPFASAVVVTGSSSISAALKATPGSWVHKSFGLEDGNAFTTGDSRQACEYRNTAGIAIGTFAIPDQMLCLIQGAISGVTNPYDGNYHIISSTFNKIKFKITRNSSNVITAFEQFSCTSAGVQDSYTSYSISGSTLTATLKQIRSAQPQRTLISMTATINSSDTSQYTAKTGSLSYTGTQDSGALEGAIDMTQAPTTMLLNAFDSRGSGSNIVRIYGQADWSNSSSPFALSGYTFGAGAANLIDNGTSSTGCWDTNNDPTTCTGSNYNAINGKTPMAASTQTISDFSGSQAWDCSGRAEASATDSFSESSGCFKRFSLTSDHIDCIQATDGGFSVTAAVGGSTLSTSSGSPTSVSASPSIVLTPNRTPNTSKFNSTTITLVNTGGGSNELSSFNFDNAWNGDSTRLTLTPTLTSGQSYILTITGGSGGVESATGDTKTMSASKAYYITAQ